MIAPLPPYRFDISLSFFLIFFAQSSLFVSCSFLSRLFVFLVLFNYALLHFANATLRTCVISPQNYRIAFIAEATRDNKTQDGIKLYADSLISRFLGFSSFSCCNTAISSNERRSSSEIYKTTRADKAQLLRRNFVLASVIISPTSF